MALEERTHDIEYAVYCDAPDCDESSYPIYDDKEKCVELARQAGWREADGKWYCPAHAAEKGEAE